MEVVTQLKENGKFPSFCKCEFPSVNVLTTFRGHIPDLINCKCADAAALNKIILATPKTPATCETLLNNCRWQWETRPVGRSSNSRSRSLSPEDTNNNHQSGAADENAFISANGRDVTFHPTYSQGTSIVRGNKSLDSGMIHYWEIRILTSLTGTDVMFGIGTDQVDLEAYQFHFTSALGKNQQSWGLSYNGNIQHQGIFKSYGHRFSQGCLVGVYLDRARGYLEFFLNRQSMGIAFHNIPLDPKVPLYPMVCSTAAKSCISLVNATAVHDSLEFRAFQNLVKAKSNLLQFIQREAPGLRPLLHKYWLVIATNYKTSVIPIRSCEAANPALGLIASNIKKNKISWKQLSLPSDLLSKPTKSDYRLKRKHKFQPTLDNICDHSHDNDDISDISDDINDKAQCLSDCSQMNQSPSSSSSSTPSHSSSSHLIPTGGRKTPSSSSTKQTSQSTTSLSQSPNYSKCKVYDLTIRSLPESPRPTPSRSTHTQTTAPAKSYQEYMHYIL